MPSHRKLSQWYHQIAHQLDAGMTLAEIIRTSEGPPAKDRIRLADLLESGQSLATVMNAAPAWMPPADRVFLVAGSETGHLPQTLQRLSDRHERIAANLRRATLGLLYPLGIFHIAALILPLVQMIDFEVGFEWDASRHFVLSASMLLPLWFVMLSAYILIRTGSPILPRFLRIVPILRKYSRAQARADLADALATFIAVGIPVPTAWRTGARITRDPEIGKAVARLEPVFAKGGDPSVELAQSKCFTPEFRALYRAGSQSGYLDQNMRKAAEQAQSEANQSLTAASIVYPGLVLAAVAGYLIFNIFKVYGSYLQGFDQFLQ